MLMDDNLQSCIIHLAGRSASAAERPTPRTNLVYDAIRSRRDGYGPRWLEAKCSNECSPAPTGDHGVTECETLSVFCYFPFTYVPDLPNRRGLCSSCSDCLVQPPVHRSTVGSRALSVAVPQVWNYMPREVTSAPSLANSCTRLKTFLFTESYPEPDLPLGWQGCSLGPPIFRGPPNGLIQPFQRATCHVVHCDSPEVSVV